MMQINMSEHPAAISEWVRLLESKEENVIFLARENIPVAKLTLVEPVQEDPCLGIAKGKFTVPEEFDDWDAEIAEMFGSDIR